MSQERRTAKLNKLKNAITKLEASHEALQKDLQSQFDRSQKRVQELKDEYGPQIKMLRAATPKAA